MAVLFTLEFILSFCVFFTLYWIVSPCVKLQNILLLSGGYIFIWLVSGYSLFVLILWSSIVWLFIRIMMITENRKKYAIVLLIAAVFWLFIFKFWGPVTDWIRELCAAHIVYAVPVVNILLPLGLSFYIFNSVSLILMAARNELQQIDIITVFLYLSFIPTFIAGPVNRASTLIPQFMVTERRIINLKKATILVTLAIIKLFLPVSLIGDRLVDPVFNLPENKSSWDILIAVYGYAWVIYLNFSGYTNLVTGIAMLLGFRVPDNFNHPYLAVTLRDFWRRWHISLSDFIKDYIYKPLGGGRTCFFRVQWNVMVAMIISGIWHGSGFNFLLWGGIHGVGMVIYNVWSRFSKDRIHFPVIFSRLLTFHYVCLAWIFFRARNIEDAHIMLRKILSCNISDITSEQLIVIFMFVSVVIIYPWIVDVTRRLGEIVMSIKWYAFPVMLIPLLTVTFYFSPSGMPEFIYAAF
ncbi:MBOAT family O-acyltransferase [Escherichia coli]|uniref:MBOAT family O-acyltransferase n=1 Tax=Escherichia coli TaxID=562 RepID=UPI000246EC25|nr:MBOAT family O-acyltransferase [Escherichia coli]EHN97281.1 hypothetical protein ESOG_04169 [Escherichia coli E101]